MKIQCWSVGKQHEPYVKAGIEEFTKRIAHYYPVDWVILPPPKAAGSGTAADMQKRESEIILSQLKKEDFLILLDERGKQFSSEGLAGFIQQKANDSTKQLVFLIGGAYGVDESIFKRADYKWSLSQLVFPHQLVRLILAEQIYRACTIIRNEKYHHS